MLMQLLIYQFIFIFIFSSNHNRFYNIDIDKILYEFDEANSPSINIIILTKEKIQNNLEFNANLISDDGKDKISLQCKNANKKEIKCLIIQNYFSINLKSKYYFYYNYFNSSKIFLNNERIFKDKNKISLIFKPEIYKNISLYKDYKKFSVKIEKGMINSGYLFITRKSKKLLKTPKNGFNKFIEQKNYISSYKNIKEYRSINSYKEAVKLGFHILDADILFTKDKIPVICHETNLEGISDGKGSLNSKTLIELQKLKFYGHKNKQEKILTFEEFLKFSKENNIIIDLDLCHLDFVEYFNKTDDYVKIILKEVEKHNMLNSVIFNSGDNINKLLKLKQYKNDIAISISQMNDKKNIENIKDKYNDSKILIYNMGNLLYGGTINYEAVKYGLSLGKKIKAAKVNDRKFADKLFSWGVNYITTQYLYPFQLKNEKEESLKIKCISTLKMISECEIDKDINLIDNEYYNIYYSNNLFNLYKEINDTPIGEFKYINTNKNRKLYYIDKYINFTEGIIKLIVSHKVKKGELIKGIIGPSYDNVAKYFLFDFICKGNDSYYLICIIIKNKKDTIELKEEEYKIYSLDNYSYNYKEVENTINKMNNSYFDKYKIIVYFILIITIFLLKIINKSHLNKIINN